MADGLNSANNGSMRGWVALAIILGLWWLDSLVDPPLNSAEPPELLHLDKVCGS
jgi:hypothetical protein